MSSIGTVLIIDAERAQRPETTRRILRKDHVEAIVEPRIDGSVLEKVGESDLVVVNLDATGSTAALIEQAERNRIPFGVIATRVISKDEFPSARFRHQLYTEPSLVSRITSTIKRANR